MWIRPLSGSSSAALVSTFLAPFFLTSFFLASFAISARAQVPQSHPTSLESEVTQVRAENGAIREQLQKLEEQQQTLLQLVDRLQRQLDGRSAAVAPQSSSLPQTEPAASADSTPVRRPQVRLRRRMR